MTHRVPGSSAGIQVRRCVHVRVNGLGHTAHVSFCLGGGRIITALSRSCVPDIILVGIFALGPSSERR